MMQEKFWEKKELSEMSQIEWESLCDGCGRCCLNKLEDEDTGEIYFTNVSCKFFDTEKCCCSDYENRKENMPDCMILNSSNEEALKMLPSSCAYSLLWRGEKLPKWHPLITGNKKSLVEAGMSIRGKIISEEFIHLEQYPEHIVNWITVK